jgi:CubicO group peptidase (beta-lactamase class C family)
VLATLPIRVIPVGSPGILAGMGEMKSVDGLGEDLPRLDRHPRASRQTPDIAGLADLMAVYQVPGVSVAAGSLGAAQWCAAFGTGGGGRSDTVSAQTVFQACSISKHVTAFGVLRLAGDGVLDLDEDIDGYLSSWRLPAGEGGWRPRVTLRQLLAHTAGLSYNWFRGYHPGEPAPSMLQVLRGEPPANTPPVRPALLPGARFRYSGSHYAVVQQLLADVTGTPFAELMHTLVLGPVGMTDSSFDQQFPHQRPGPAALGHHATGTPVGGGWRVLPEMAGAGLWTTPADLVRFELEIIRASAGQSPLLAAELAAQMLVPQVPGGMGLGTEIGTEAGPVMFGHTGSNIGYTCFSFAWPGTGTAVAAMANSEDASELLATLLTAARRRYAPPPDARAHTGDVTGRYLLRDDYPLHLGADAGTLTLTAPGQRPAALHPMPGGRYHLPGLDCEISFGHTGGQPVLSITQEGTTQATTRTP